MISHSDIENLRGEISKRLSCDRYTHTLGVERAAVFLAQMCLPEKECELRAAALLHDVTKELSTEEHFQILRSAKQKILDKDRDFIPILHSFTAPAVISADFPEFATDQILSAVYNHTLGDSDMTVFDEIIFLADFIEDTR